MALDLTDASGDLDRSKVLAELDRLWKLLPPIPDEPLLTSVASRVKGGVKDLLDEVQHHAYINGQVDAEATERANN